MLWLSSPHVRVLSVSLFCSATNFHDSMEELLSLNQFQNDSYQMKLQCPVQLSRGKNLDCMPLREVTLPILPPNFSLGSTVGIVQKQKSRVLPRDNCTGHCSIICFQFSAVAGTVYEFLS